MSQVRILLGAPNSKVGARGFEPPTSCAQGRRATRLRYAPLESGGEVHGFPPPIKPFTAPRRESAAPGRAAATAAHVRDARGGSWPAKSAPPGAAPGVSPGGKTGGGPNPSVPRAAG